MSRVDLSGKNVLVTLPLNDVEKQAFAELIEGAGATATLIREPNVQEHDIDAATLIVGNVPASLLYAPEGLLWLQTSSAGYDHYLKDGMLAEGTRLSSAAGTYGQAVSEHMFAQLLCLMKKLHLYRDNQAMALWCDEGTVRTLAGANVLVLGAGSIGSGFARLCVAMGAHVTGARRTVVDACDPFERMITMDQIFDVLGEMDVVASALPSTPETRGLAGERFFATMRKGSYFVNGGRGDLVDSDALVKALREGHLAGAALDVTNPEPLPAEHALWAEPNALITPHISGFWHLPEQTACTVALCRDNLEAFIAGEPLTNEVNR